MKSDGLKSLSAKPKFGQDGCELFSIFGRWSDQDIEVASVPGPAVKSQTVSADNYVFNVAEV
jgi:hypothetical protein